MNPMHTFPGLMSGAYEALQSYIGLVKVRLALLLFSQCQNMSCEKLNIFHHALQFWDFSAEIWCCSTQLYDSFTKVPKCKKNSHGLSKKKNSWSRCVRAVATYWLRPGLYLWREKGGKEEEEDSGWKKVCVIHFSSFHLSQHWRKPLGLSTCFWWSLTAIY